MAQLNQSGFSRDTFPNLYNRPVFGTEFNSAENAYNVPKKDNYPTRDQRYPAYSAPMQDARLVTDYRPQCSKNIKPGNQFYTKLWLINHADTLIDESRRRQVEWTGASLIMANTVPPPENIVHSNPFYSEISKTGFKNGQGIERSNTPAPQLFGTFTFEPTMTEIRNNRKNIGLTQYYEGGRNTPRGI